MIEYVVGFAFSKDKSSIVLIKKNKPEWQRGKFNGVGGKIEGNETPIQAMEREFKEETGVLFDPAENDYLAWHQFATLKFEGCNLHCFRIFNNQIHQCGTMETEEIVVHPTHNISQRQNLIPNLKVLIPMAMDEEFIFADINAVVR